MRARKVREMCAKTVSKTSILYYYNILTYHRIKRVKVQRSFDPEVVKSVEAKLKTLQVHDEGHSSPLSVEAT